MQTESKLCNFSLSHSDTEDDESDTTEDDDEIELRRTKPIVSARQSAVRSSRAKKFTKVKSERSPLQLKTARVEAEANRLDRMQRSGVQTTVLQAFREERKLSPLGATKVILLSPGKTQRLSVLANEISVCTTIPVFKCN